MEKTKYIAPDIEVIRFTVEDVVTTSGGFDGDVDEFSEYSAAETYDNW